MASRLSSAPHPVDQVPPIGKLTVLGIQHVLAFYAGAVVVPLVIASGLGLDNHTLVHLINADLLTCGIATIIQSAGIGRFIGVKLPLIQGVTFTAVSPLIAIGAAATPPGADPRTGLATMYGSIIAVGLLEDDELVLVHPVREQDEAVLVTYKGYAIRFACSEVRSMGRSARGVKGISLRKGDHVVAAVFLKGGDTSTTIMSISENGYGKRTQSRLYKLQSRGGMGVINFRITNKTGDVVSAMPVTENDGLAMLTSNNKIVRIGVSEVSSTGRSTMGVKCVNLDGGARVVACDRIDNGGIVANSMDGGEDADTSGDRG